MCIWNLMDIIILLLQFSNGKLNPVLKKIYTDNLIDKAWNTEYWKE